MLEKLEFEVFDNTASDKHVFFHGVIVESSKNNQLKRVYMECLLDFMVSIAYLKSFPHALPFSSIRQTLLFVSRLNKVFTKNIR